MERKISYSKNNSARSCYKCVNVFMYSISYSCHILMKPELSRQIILKKTSNIKFHLNPSMRTDEQTDKQ
jgi:hypothetical protein